MAGSVFLVECGTLPRAASPRYAATRFWSAPHRIAKLAVRRIASMSVGIELSNTSRQLDVRCWLPLAVA